MRLCINVRSMKRGRQDGRDSQDEHRPRISRVNEETVTYFDEIDAHFRSVSDEEEKNLMADNVLGETAGRESEIVPDAVCSRVLEALIPHASPALVVKFIEGCILDDNLGVICTSGPFGSHVLEKVLIHIGRASETADEATYALFEGALASFTEVAVASLYEMITSKYGSFVARRLLCVLSGRDVSSPPQRKQPELSLLEKAHAAGEPLDRQQGPQRTRPGGLVARVGGMPSSQSLSTNNMGPGFPNLLQTISNTILTDDWAREELNSLQCDPFAGPFLQALLRAAAPHETLAGRLVIQLLGGSPTAGPTSCTADALYRLLTDRNGSHLMEAAFESAPDDVFQKLCTIAFRGRLLSLAQHPCANFGVQAALAVVRKPQQLKRMFEDLSPHLSTLLRGRRGGVVAVLLAAAGRLQALQLDCANSLWHSVDSGLSGGDESRASTPLHKLLTLDTTTVLGRGTGRLSPLGCAALISVLQYPTEAIKKWATAIGDLTSEELVTIARDPGGCRVLETYLDGPGGAPKKRRRVLEFLAGGWAAVASTGAGARFVEKCYDLAEIAIKQTIASELAVAEARLAATYRGAALLQRCNIRAVKAGGDWQHKITAGDSTVREYEELFGGGIEGAEAKSVQGDDVDGEPKTKKKKKKRLHEKGPGDNNGVADKKKKEKKKLKDNKV